mmetsp:Transcript_27904/g.61569  ORF Transcript_27904/g.61569 Transcript_27904/m.61569 type:complete len:246 (+) Transcript_27904:129-866(+)
MEAACKGSTQLPFSSDKKINLSALAEEDYMKTSLRIASASAYGAVLMEDGLKPLMKQRLTHICIKHIKKITCTESQHIQTGNSAQIGLLMVVCHVVCASDLSKLNQAIVHSLATLLVKGFSTDLFEYSSRMATNLPAETARARTLTISALLKLLCTAPTAVDGFVLEIVSGLLRSYAISDPSAEIGCKLVTLQALEVLTHLNGAKDSILAVKPAVITILSSAMSQKNVLLRSAAVDVRNMWCLIT